MKIESGISGRCDAVDWLVIESIAQKEESVNRYYHKFDIVLIWEMGPSGEQTVDLTVTLRFKCQQRPSAMNGRCLCFMPSTA